MKKYLFVILILVLCFVLSSFAYYALYPFRVEEPINKLPDTATQKMYALMSAIDDYEAPFRDSASPVIDKLAQVLASRMIVDYDSAAKAIATSDDAVITVFFIDAEAFSFANNLSFDFSAYNSYMSALSYNAMEQIYRLAGDETLYTKERKINVSFSVGGKKLQQKAMLNQNDMVEIQNICYEDAARIYSEYIKASDISAAFFCKSIKELPLDDIVEIYNEHNAENPLTEQWRKELFAGYAKHYIDNLIIRDIIYAETDGQSTSSITYDTQDGSDTINNVFQSMLNTYYLNKQPPVDKSLTAGHFGQELLEYTYPDAASLSSKNFDFTYSRKLNNFTLNEDFYIEIVNDIYEEFIVFDDFLDEYYALIQEQYFFVERPIAETSIIADNTNSSRYRQLDISVAGSTDCYIKLLVYDPQTDTSETAMLIAYIKAGDALHLFIPEGDYALKYATGSAWYGDMYMFSDEGQYYMGTDIISVHEYMMTTTIELGSSDGGSIPAYSQTPDLF